MIGVGFHWTWITFLLFQCNFEKRHPFYYFSDCSKLSRIFNNCSVNLIFSFLIRWISSSWAIFIWRWFLSSSSKDFWICWRLSRCRAAASRFLLRLRFRCSSLKVYLPVMKSIQVKSFESTYFPAYFSTYFLLSKNSNFIQNRISIDIPI